MKHILIVVLMLCYCLVFSQCSLQFLDTTHVNCNGQNTGSFSVNVVAENPYTLFLSNGETLVNGGGFSNLLAGNYEVILLDGNQCSDTLEIKIKEPPELIAEIRCVGSAIVANVEGGVSDYTIVWKDQQGEVISNESVVDYQPNTYYDFQVNDSKGCSVSDVINVSADFTVSDSIGEFPFEVDIINNSSNSYDFSWDFGDGNSSSLPNPTHIYEAVGSYLLELSVQDEHECVDHSSVQIDVQGFESSSNDWQEMSNAFSPNGDGINDQFSFMDNHAIVQFKVQIFNRWGNLVYFWTDPKESWSGVDKNGNKLAQGVYFYQMKGTGLNGLEYTKKGCISIY